IIIPWAIIAIRWAPVHASLVFPAVQQVLSPSYWTFYLEPLPRLFSVVLLALAAAGAIVGMADARWRREVRWAGIWIAVGLAAFSFIMAKEERYILFLAPPVVMFGMIGLLSLSSWGAALVGGSSSWLLRSGMAAVLAFHM